MLSELINEFGCRKAELDTMKKHTDKLNAQIKQIFKDEGLSDYDEPDCGYVAKMAIVSNDNINETLLINVLKSLDKVEPSVLQSVIKTREYIDSDALEDAIYTGKISADIVNSCIEHKEPTYRLTVKRRK